MREEERHGGPAGRPCAPTLHPIIPACPLNMFHGFVVGADAYLVKVDSHPRTLTPSLSPVSGVPRVAPYVTNDESPNVRPPDEPRKEAPPKAVFAAAGGTGGRVLCSFEVGYPGRISHIGG